MLNFLFINRKKRNTFYYKILILIICSIEIFLLAFSFFVFGNFENIVYDKITDLNYEITAKVGNNVANMSGLIDNFCNAVYFDPIVLKLMFNDGNMSDFEIQSSLNRVSNIIKAYAIIDSIIIYNKSMDVFYSALDSYAEDEILDMVRKRESLPYLPIIRKLPKEAYLKEEIVLTYFKFNSFDAKSNVVIINVKIDWLQSVFKSEAPDGAKLFLINSNDDLIVDSSNTNSIYKFEREYLKEVREKSINNFSNVHFLKKEKVVVMFYSIPDTDWYLVNEGDDAVFYNSITIMKGLTVVITIVFMIAGIIIALLIAGNLYKPFKNIVNTVENTFGDLKKEQFKTDIQYIQEAVSYSKNFSKFFDSYMLKELLTNNGKANSEVLSHVIAHNTRLSGRFSVLLILIDVLEISEGIKDKIKAGFQGIDCDFVEINYDKLLIIADNETKGMIDEAIEKLPCQALSICIGGACHSVEGILQEYQELTQQAKYKLIYDGGGILEKEKVQVNFSNAVFLFPDALCSQIISALQEEMMEDAKAHLHSFLDTISQSNISNYHMALIQLLLSLGEKHSVLGERQSYYLDMILAAKTKRDIVECFEEIFLYIIESRQNATQNTKNLVAEVIKDYIKNHFAETDLSTKSIATEFKMSPAYIGRLFRKTFGYTIADYINEMRIEKALALLKNTKRSVSQIMKSVGYENESTFFKIFKAYCNTTPKGYRISLVNEGNENEE